MSNIDRNSTAVDFSVICFSDKTLSIEEKVLLAHSAKERADIVDKYDRVSRQNYLIKERMANVHSLPVHTHWQHK